MNHYSFKVHKPAGEPQVAVFQPENQISGKHQQTPIGIPPTVGQFSPSRDRSPPTNRYERYERYERERERENQEYRLTYGCSPPLNPYGEYFETKTMFGDPVLNLPMKEIPPEHRERIKREKKWRDQLYGWSPEYTGPVTRSKANNTQNPSNSQSYGWLPEYTGPITRSMTRSMYTQNPSMK